MTPPERASSSGKRETFASSAGLIATMIGVAVGLGNVWRFPYMVGQFGGAPFVLVYVLAVVLIGIPALMAEWTLGRSTRRGPVGGFARGGLPGGKAVGWFFFLAVTLAMSYYTLAIGWVLYFAVGQFAIGAGLPWAQGAVLSPETGFDLRSFCLQGICLLVVLLATVVVLLKGLRKGIEGVSRWIVPALFVSLLVLAARSLTLPGAWEGVQWYILKVDLAALSPGAILAAVGQAVFSLSLGGTFMVVYGSYLNREENLRRSAVWTAGGDLAAGLLAGIAIFPAVFALGLEPGSGPGLIFATLPEVFAAIPFGWVFGALFFTALLAAAYLSDISALEVVVAGLTDNTSLSRQRATWMMAAIVFVFAIPPMINQRIFVLWDLVLGSGMQTLGSLLAVLTVGWCLHRGEALRSLAGETPGRTDLWLYYWLRFVIPAAIAAVGVWWVAQEVLS
ncbi:MAG: sodium-dependent transporter [Deltaproteobacteria bacterium]|nr:sodium-dependent transporter [Deltaproteobacteria bacterium]